MNVNIAQMSVNIVNTVNTAQLDVNTLITVNTAQLGVNTVKTVTVALMNVNDVNTITPALMNVISGQIRVDTVQINFVFELYIKILFNLINLISSHVYKHHCVSKQCM